MIYEDAQQQEGSNDCGCSALAYATTLCHGQNPSQVKHDQKVMRNHLHVLDGLDTGELIEFPIVGQHSPDKPVTQQIHVYCICRLTDDGSEMIQCSICDEWFHISSINIDTIKILRGSRLDLPKVYIVGYVNTLF